MKKVLTLLASACLLVVFIPIAGHASGSSALCLGRVRTIVGTPGPDVIHGTRGTDVIRGLRGNDKIFGGGGRDFICGGRGRDKIHGDRTSATTYGAPGDDVMSGGRGDDRILGEGTFSARGDDFLGGPGDDYMAEAVDSQRLGDSARYNKIDYRHASGPIWVRHTGPAAFTITGEGLDTIDASQIGTLYGSRHDDLIQGAFALLYAMGGSDTIIYDGSSSNTGGSSLEIWGDGGSAPGQTAGTDGNDTIVLTKWSIESGVWTGGGNDTVTGDAGPVTWVRGGLGDDTLKGSSYAAGEEGNDTIVGSGEGSDSLVGGPGSDTITGTTANDYISGNEGDDTLDARDGISANDTVDGGDGTDACSFDQGDTVLNCP
jgi:Ca2+-binding RTX toxin-like protein